MDIKRICEEEKEYNLEFYCECFIKMLRAYHKTEQEEMLSYVCDTLKPAFPLVVTYFLEQVSECLELEENASGTRTGIIQDIEKSLIEFDGFFDAIVRSTNYADRILIQTAPMDTAMRYVSPKLCTYYSLLLDSYVKLISGEQNGGYAFCVYPSLNQVAEAHILFQTRQKSGKVCVIRVPGRHFSNVKMIRTWLMHEMFHVIPSENMRLREKRHGPYLYMILYRLEVCLLKGCDRTKFSIDEKEVRKLLIEPVMGKITAELEKQEKNKRIFYSESLKNICVKEIRNLLYEIQETGQERFIEYVIEKSGKERVFNSMSKLPAIRNNFVQIRSNIYQIIANSEIENICNFYMNVFREVFADLFTVITLHLSKNGYFNALEAYLWKEKKDEDEKYDRISLLIRAAFVVEVMCGGSYMGIKEDIELFGKWKEDDGKDSDKKGSLLFETEQFRKNIFQQSEKNALNNTTLCKDKKAREERKGITLTNRMREIYQEYFKSCCESYLKFREDHEKMVKDLDVRFKINGIVTADDISSCSVAFNNTLQ